MRIAPAEQPTRRRGVVTRDVEVEHGHVLARAAVHPRHPGAEITHFLCQVDGAVDIHRIQERLGRIHVGEFLVVGIETPPRQILNLRAVVHLVVLVVAQAPHTVLVVVERVVGIQCLFARQDPAVPTGSAVGVGRQIVHVDVARRRARSTDIEATRTLLRRGHGPVHAAGVVHQHHHVGLGAGGELEGQIRELEVELHLAARQRLRRRRCRDHGQGHHVGATRVRQGAIGNEVLESIVAREVHVRRIGERAVGVDHQRAVRRRRLQHDGHRVAVEVDGPQQQPRRQDVDKEVLFHLIRRQWEAQGGVVQRVDGDGHRAGADLTVHVLNRVGEEVHTREVLLRRVAQGEVALEEHGAVGRGLGVTHTIDLGGGHRFGGVRIDDAVDHHGDARADDLHRRILEEVVGEHVEDHVGHVLIVGVGIVVRDGYVVHRNHDHREGVLDRDPSGILPTDRDRGRAELIGLEIQRQRLGRAVEGDGIEQGRIAVADQRVGVAVALVVEVHIVEHRREIDHPIRIVLEHGEVDDGDVHVRCVVDRVHHHHEGVLHKDAVRVRGTHGHRRDAVLVGAVVEEQRVGEDGRRLEHGRVAVHQRVGQQLAVGRDVDVIEVLGEVEHRIHGILVHHHVDERLHQER